MIKLICLVKRKPGMSPEEFHRYWRNEHGPLVASTRSGRHALRYEQNHRALEDYERDPEGYDGATEQWFSSVEDFHDSLREDDYGLIAQDVERFLDTTQLVFLLTEEAEVVFDRSP
ncbi:MAG: EthD domain-containing protein [Acidimicrobiales bacterium]